MCVLGVELERDAVAPCWGWIGCDGRERILMSRTGEQVEDLGGGEGEPNEAVGEN